MKAFLIAIVIISIMVSPIILIWAVNALFGLGIVLSMKTWFAGFVLIVLFGRGV